MAGDIEMTIDAVREIANRTMGALRSKAQTSSRAFGDVDLPPAAFGGWQQAVALGRHHQGAHEVFVKTLEGVVADLEEFAHNLRDTVDSSERRDEEVEAALLALGRGYRHHTFRSQRRYTAAVEAESGLEGVHPGMLSGDESPAASADETATPGQVEPGDVVGGGPAGETPAAPGVRPGF